MVSSQLPRTLLIEGHGPYARLLQRHMKADFQVDFAFSPAVALRKLADHDYAIVIIGGHMPDVLPAAVCREIRSLRPKVIIIALLDDAALPHRLSTLTAGADAWLGQPLHYAELCLVSQNMLRRQPLSEHTRLHYQDIELDTGSRTVRRGGQPVLLTPKQFATLECLLLYAESVVSRETFTRHLWDYAQTGWNQTLDVHISTLRAKIDRPFPVPLIQTVRGHGYKLSIHP